MWLRRLTACISIIALLIAFSSATSAAWIAGKARLAQHLLDVAWQTSQQLNRPVKPWNWADIRTIGRLQVPSRDESLVVLNDASGEAMAFGPGLVAGDPARAATSSIAIGGHRDTHLAFLQHQKPGDLFLLETLEGKIHRYRYLDSQIVDTRLHSLSISTQNPGLVLITCYPFDARQTGGPLRLVVRAAYVPS